MQKAVLEYLRTPSRHRTWAAAAICLAFSLETISAPAVRSQTSAPQTAPLPVNARLTGHIRYSRIGGPQQGVRLLDDIFMRVRSAPQVAMAKNNLKQQSQEIAQSKGKADYTLAIRPKPTGKSWQQPAPALQLVPSEPANEIASDLLRKSGQFGGSGGSVNVGSSLSAAGAGAEPQMLLGSRKVPLMSNNPVQHGTNGLWELNSGSSLISSAQDRSITTDYNCAPATTAPAPMRSANNKNELLRDSAISRRQTKPAQAGGERQVPDLATAFGRLASINKALDEEQKLALAPPAAVPASPVTSKLAEETAYRGLDKKAARPADSDSQNNAEAVRSQTEIRAKLKAKKSSAAAKERQVRLDALDDERDSGNNQTAKDGRSRLAMGADIALLPPNIVTGIPLVRLGISQHQAHNALATMGDLRQDKVNKWTVWSWQRHHQAEPQDTSLQLYIRNNTGLLDAMRIFDPGLIAPDFGVSLGDSLARVKEKFGEPAFILPEPAPGAGQNYIYPISQVGFQLARPAPDEQPRVVSILIFNVK